MRLMFKYLLIILLFLGSCGNPLDFRAQRVVEVVIKAKSQQEAPFTDSFIYVDSSGTHHEGYINTRNPRYTDKLKVGDTIKITASYDTVCRCLYYPKHIEEYYK